jgi:glycosyltransferase involved in cell wall biosynthesis
MRIAVFNGFWPVRGGGEAVASRIIHALSTDHQVTNIVLSSQQNTAADYTDSQAVETLLVRTMAEVSERTCAFDMFVNTSHGSRILNQATLGVYYCHFPSLVSQPRRVQVLNRLPLRMRETAVRHAWHGLRDVVQGPVDSYSYDSYQVILANSEFTRDWILRRWRREAEVVEPPVAPIRPEKQSPHATIVSIGRFIDPDVGHSKHQLLMVNAFEELLESCPATELILCGGASSRSDHRYLKLLRRRVGRLPVRVVASAMDSDVRAFAASAWAGWHAAGMGVDGRANPEGVEHFGIAPIELASTGAPVLFVPVGGPRESARDIPWMLPVTSTVELAQRTADVLGVGIMSDAIRLERHEIVSRRFGSARFDQSIRRVIATLRGVGSPSSP